jgi:2-keto-4-pentenoate hydratase/2-oxohepta-3-ene-1,7-dioic acid hydratase in catechol pathway
MKFVRYRYQGAASYGILDGETIQELNGGLFGDIVKTGHLVDLNSVELLCPCEPSKILAVGLNYQSHLGNFPGPKNPEIFFVPVSALLEPGGAIRIPHGAHDVHFEGELVVVIGKKTKQVIPSEAGNYIFGFSCGNDISEREWQKKDMQWWRAKGSDTFAPLGPAITTGFDWKQSRIETRVNGVLVQSGRFNELLFDPPAIVSFISRHVTLFPGDVIYTGTPGTTSGLKPGDLVEVDISEIGVLRNRIESA